MIGFSRYKITALRSALGLSKVAFGRILHIDGSVLSRWEKGETTPSVDNLVNICNVCDVPISYFFVTVNDRP